MGDDERRALRALDDAGDREGLAAARDAEQHLMFLAVAEAAHERFDGLRLVALRLKFGTKLKRHVNRITRRGRKLKKR